MLILSWAFPDASGCMVTVAEGVPPTSLTVGHAEEKWRWHYRVSALGQRLRFP